MSQAGKVGGGGSGGGGDVNGPGSSTDRAIATWNGTTGTALFDNPTTHIDSAGRETNTGQPAFVAYLSAPITNVIGAGSVYTVVFDATVTNQSSWYNTATGTATAPVTGIYYFTTNLTIISTTAANTTFIILFNGSIYQQRVLQINDIGVMTTEIHVLGSFCIPMTAGDTMQVQVILSGSTDTSGFFGTPPPWGVGTLFSGFLIC